jgi:hypothetical protein
MVRSMQPTSACGPHGTSAICAGPAPAPPSLLSDSSESLSTSIGRVPEILEVKLGVGRATPRGESPLYRGIRRPLTSQVKSTRRSVSCRQLTPRVGFPSSSHSSSSSLFAHGRAAHTARLGNGAPGLSGRRGAFGGGSKWCVVSRVKTNMPVVYVSVEFYRKL